MATIPEKLDPQANRFAEKFQKVVKKFGPEGANFNVLLDSEENTAAGPADGDLDLKVIPQKSFNSFDGYNAGERALKALNIPGDSSTFGTGFTPSEQFVVTEIPLGRASEFAKSLIPERPSNFEGSLPGPNPDQIKNNSNMSQELENGMDAAKRVKSLVENNTSLIIVAFFILGAIGVSLGPLDFE